MIICPVYLCVFYLSFLEIGLVKIDLMYSLAINAISCGSCDLIFPESRFCKKKAVFKRLFHSSGILEIFFSRKWVFLDVFFIGMLFSFCVGHSGKAFVFLKLISLESVSCYGYFVQCELWVFFVCIFQNGHIGNLSSFFLTLSCCNYVSKCYDVYLYKHAGVLRCQLCLGPQCYGRAAACGGSYWRPLLTACYGALQVCRSGLDPGYLVFPLAGARRWIYHVLARVVRVPELLRARWPRDRYYAHPTLFLTRGVV